MAKEKKVKEKKNSICIYDYILIECLSFFKHILKIGYGLVFITCLILHFNEFNHTESKKSWVASKLYSATYYKI